MIEKILKGPGAEKVTAFLEALNGCLEVGMTIGEALSSAIAKAEEKEKANGTPPPNTQPPKTRHSYEGIKKNTIVHPKSYPAGMNIKVETDSTGHVSSQPATDTLNY